jgi:DHA2 family multidrug resistance protein-like MFS transporter
MASPVSEAATVARAGRREWTALAVLALPLLLVSMDVSVLYFAVPFISRDLAATATEQLWILDIYGFVLAGLLVTMGALGDRIGRRRLLLLGAAGFGAASLAAAFAGTAVQLIAARAVLGVGGATLMPSTLALVRAMFEDPRQRSRAIAIWTTVMMGGISLGPVLSGLLLEHFWWGSVFLMNLPAMVLLLALGPVLVPESKAPAPGPFDAGSSLLSLATVLPVVFGIKRLASDGWGPVPAIALVVGLTLGVLFVRRQRRSAHPMLDLAMFRVPDIRGAIGANVVAMFALVGNSVFVTQYLQLYLGMSPLRAALWSLLPSVVVAGAAPLATALGQRLPPFGVVAGGLVIAAGGFTVMSTVRADSSLLVIIVGASLLAFGLVGVMSLVTELVMGAIDPERAGAASAVTETSSELGGALGIALLGSVGTAFYRASVDSALPASLRHGALGQVREGLAGGLAAAGQAPGSLAGELLHAAKGAFLSGMHAADLVGAALLVLAAAAVAGSLRGHRSGRYGSGDSGRPLRRTV